MAESRAARLKGIWAAVVTPIGASLHPDAAKAIAYYRDLLAAGCDGINMFGTTGEAMSFSAGQRRKFMEAIATSGLPMERVMAGTGAASLDEAAFLTQSAVDLGFAAVLLMPPFFYRDATDNGVLSFFAEIFARVPVPPQKTILYNFPAMSGITFNPDLVDRLVATFPQEIGGLKDSSNDRSLQAALHARHPALAVLPGSEHYLAEALAEGAAGCISGSVALWPELSQRVYRHAAPEDSRRLAALRATLSGLPFIAAVRHRIARQRNDDAWRGPMPPLTPLSISEREELEHRLDLASS